MLALAWEPLWLQGYCASRADIVAEMPGAYFATHLSVHGLWPNYDDAVHPRFDWPEYCKGAATDGGLDYTACSSRSNAPSHCAVSSTTRAAFASSRYARPYEHSYCSTWSHTLASLERIYSIRIVAPSLPRPTRWPGYSLLAHSALTSVSSLFTPRSPPASLARSAGACTHRSTPSRPSATTSGRSTGAAPGGPSRCISPPWRRRTKRRRPRRGLRTSRATSGKPCRTRSSPKRSTRDRGARRFHCAAPSATSRRHGCNTLRRRRRI